jgi:hypothetical protein
VCVCVFTKVHSTSVFPSWLDMASELDALCLSVQRGCAACSGVLFSKRKQHVDPLLVDGDDLDSSCVFVVFYGFFL